MIRIDVMKYALLIQSKRNYIIIIATILHDKSRTLTEECRLTPGDLRASLLRLLHSHTDRPAEPPTALTHTGAATNTESLSVSYTTSSTALTRRKKN